MVKGDETPQPHFWDQNYLKVTSFDAEFPVGKVPQTREPPPPKLEAFRHLWIKS